MVFAAGLDSWGGVGVDIGVQLVEPAVHVHAQPVDVHVCRHFAAADPAGSRGGGGAGGGVPPHARAGAGVPAIIPRARRRRGGGGGRAAIAEGTVPLLLPVLPVPATPPHAGDIRVTHQRQLRHGCASLRRRPRAGAAQVGGIRGGKVAVDLLERDDGDEVPRAAAARDGAAAGDRDGVADDEVFGADGPVGRVAAAGGAVEPRDVVPRGGGGVLRGV